MFDLLLGIWPKLALAGGALVAMLLAVLGIRKSGKDAAENEAMRDTLKRTEAGRHAVSDARGDDPDKRLRDNDGRW